MPFLSSAHGFIKRVYLGFQPRAVVLMYHRVAEGVVDPFSLCVSPHNFQAQLDVLTERYRVLRLEDILARLQEGNLPSRAVAITFDDGYADNAHAAADLLARSETPATVFVTSGYLNGKREYWWDELVRLVFESRSDPSLWVAEDPELSSACQPGAGKEEIIRQLQPLLRGQSPDRLDATLARIAVRAGLERIVRETHRPMSAAECAALANGGLVTIGAHTIHHAWLSALSEADQQKELRESKRALEEITGAPVRTMAYPYGRKESVSSQTLGLVRDAGFTAACANERGLVKADVNPYWIPRFLPHDLDGDAFAKRMEGFFQDHSAVRMPSGTEGWRGN
jgi:peptidoglycan/xylan/chitin deacetylase (PgdA/CDA1 family)